MVDVELSLKRSTYKSKIDEAMEKELKIQEKLKRELGLEW